MRRHDVFGDRWVVAAAATVTVLQILYAFLAHPVFDADGYLRLGRDFSDYWQSSGQGYWMRTPGYPLLLAGIYEAGLGATGLKIFQICLVTGGLLALAKVTELAANRRTARICAWLFVCYVPLWSYSSIARTEAVAIPLLIFAVLALLLSERTNHSRVPWLLAAGAMSGLALIVRPNCVSVVAVIAIVLLIQQFRSQRRRSAVAMAAVFFALPIVVIFTPWLARNVTHEGHLDPLGRNPFPLALGLHLPYERDIGEFASFHRSYRFFWEHRSDGFTPEIAFKSNSWEVLKDNLRSHTKEFFETRAVGEFQMWPWPATPRVDYEDDSVVPYPLIMLIQVLLLVLGLFGLYGLRKNCVGMIGLGFVASLFAIHLLYVALPRYTVPVFPFLLIGAAAFLDQRWRSRAAGGHADLSVN